jgi:hypothetical protein
MDAQEIGIKDSSITAIAAKSARFPSLTYQNPLNIPPFPRALQLNLSLRLSTEGDTTKRSFVAEFFQVERSIPFSGAPPC